MKFAIWFSPNRGVGIEKEKKPAKLILQVFPVKSVVLVTRNLVSLS